MDDLEIERNTYYCLDQIDTALIRTRYIELDLCDPNRKKPLSYQEEWAIRETLRDIKVQANMLRKDLERKKSQPKKKGLMQRFWGMY